MSDSPRMQRLKDPKGLKDFKKSIHNTFHMKDRNQMIWWAGDSQRILQWLAGGVLWPSSGCTCSRFLWFGWFPRAVAYFPCHPGKASFPPGCCFYSLVIITPLPCKISGLVGFVRYLVPQVSGAIKYQDQLKPRHSELENPSVSVFRAFY